MNNDINSQNPIPIFISEFKMIGFAISNALPGDQTQVLARALITSDSEEFHHYVRGFSQEIEKQLQNSGKFTSLSKVSNFALVVHPDKTGSLYLDNFGISIQVISKKPANIGEDVYTGDIGDVKKADFNFSISSNDRIIVCIRHGWRFLLYFDLMPDTPLDIDAMQTSIGMALRRFMFDKLYASLDQEDLIKKIFDAGWFPFNEIVGGEFEDLAQAISNEFNVESKEKTLIESFDEKRINKITEKWWRDPRFMSRKPLLEEGVQAFCEGKYISCIKILITEIEGIMREQHIPKAEGRQGVHTIISETMETVSEKLGADTLYFPSEFLNYIRISIFSNFDPSETATTATRHSVSHGKAPSTAYTSAKSLQTILTLDQINRYLTLPQAEKVQ